MQTLLTRKYLGCFLLGAMVILPFSAAYGMTVPDIDTMMTYLTQSLDNVIFMLVAIAYVLGIFFIFSGVHHFKKAGEAQAQSYGKAVSGPLLKLVIGSSLMFLPTVIEVARWTLWDAGHEDPIFKYQPAPGDIWQPVINAVILLLKTLGFVSLIRGFVVLNHISLQSMQPQTAGKALTFIVGGLLCINVVAITKIIGNTLGFTS